MGNPGKLAVAAGVILIALQFVRPPIPAKPATAEVEAPAQVRLILNRSCHSCHSDERRLAWFDEVVPAYWLVRHDVLTARGHLNFSALGGKPAAAQRATLFEAVNMIQLGAMPLPMFLKLHPEARVTPEELATLKTYLNPWGSPPEPATAAAERGSPQVDLSAVAAEFGGFPFDASFESWKLISTTDRGDNRTFRFILGNDIAVRAAQSGNISPWPDGTRFAKIAWQQQQGADGLIYPGKFVQVELMVKDASRYRGTEGWGWGRWRGLNLQPYGTGAQFVEECTGCHLPMRGDDYVYTLPMTAARSNRGELLNTSAGQLPAGLPWQPLGWSPITMFVDPDRHTTGTLLGNDAAMRAVHPRAGETAAPAYEAGAVLALVTWAQRDDPHWFGGRIPDRPVAVEFVQIGASGSPGVYRRYAGAELAEEHPAAADAEQRREFLVNLRPVQLP